MNAGFLLDTHTFLWSLCEPERLSDRARDCLEASESKLWVSSVSFFEIANKVRIGKLAVADDVLSRWDWILSRLNAQPVGLTVPDSIVAGGWPSPHRDPFDRLLAAQAKNNKLILVTCDTAFSTFSEVETLW